MKAHSKIKSIIWYLLRPSYLPHLLYQVSLKFKKNRETEREEVVAWCKSNTISTENALRKLTHTSMVLEKISESYSNVISESQKTANDCPVNMGGAGNLDLVFNLAKQENVKRIIETGVAYGWSSLAMLLGLKGKNNSKLISIDMPYLQMNNDQYVGCVVPDHLKYNWKLIRKSDRQALKKAIKELGQLDMCHYDSDKTYYGRMWAYPKLWDALKPGGYFISDDINDNFAFRDFCLDKERDAYITEYGGKYIGVLQK